MRKCFLNQRMQAALYLGILFFFLGLPCLAADGETERLCEAVTPEGFIDPKIEFDSASFVNAWLKKHYTGPCVRLLKQTSYDNDSPDPQSYYTFQYNNTTGRVVTDRFYSRDPNDNKMKYTAYHKYAYAFRKLVRKKKFSPSNSLLEYYVYTYNPSGLLTKIQTYTNSGAKGECEIYEYDADGDVAKITRRKSNNALKYYLLVKYSPTKRAYKVKMYYPFNSYVGYANIYYDTAGKPIKVTAFSYPLNSLYKRATLKYQLCP